MCMEGVQRRLQMMWISSRKFKSAAAAWSKHPQGGKVFVTWYRRAAPLSCMQEHFSLYLSGQSTKAPDGRKRWLSIFLFFFHLDLCNRRNIQLGQIQRLGLPLQSLLAVGGRAVLQGVRMWCTVSCTLFTGPRRCDHQKQVKLVPFMATLTQHVRALTHRWGRRSDDWRMNLGTAASIKLWPEF